MTRHAYGWAPDIPDIRDHLFAPRPSAKARPKQVDLRPGCSPVEDQGDLGSCTGNAIVGALEYLERKTGKRDDLSRLFIYYQERAIEHSIKYDSGAMIRDGVKACHKVGVCTEKLWPYLPAKFASKPKPAAYTDASNRKISEYLRVGSLNGMLEQLADGYPVVFGFSVYESFESNKVARTGSAHMPVSGEPLVGGHAVLAVGYDDTQRRILARNSWGASWGMGGYFTLPYAYLDDRNLSDDFWTIRK